MPRSHAKSDSIFGRLRQFFYTEESPYGLALVRIFLPAAAMIPMFRRFGVLRELFSNDGTPQPLFEVFGQVNPLPILPPQVAAALYGLMMFGMVCAILGWKTRISFCLAVPLYIYFNLLDCVGTMTKYSVIATHLLILLTLSNCGAVWSVDALLRRRELGPAATAVPHRFPVWPARLMQILFCFVYFGAALTKLQTDSFFSGEQMRYWMLSNWNYANPVGENLAMWTPALLVSAYITVVWEIVFAFLVWRPGLRNFVLAIGTFFHVMTWLTLGLYIFPAICISGYLAFINERDIVAIRRALHRVRFPTRLLGAPPRLLAWLVELRPSSVPVATAWLGTAVLAAIGAAELEYRMDAYGMLANNGPMPLRTIDQNVAMKMINDKTPLREKDKFFSFDIGTRLVGGQLADRSSVFEYGDTIIAQCNLNPPHEDLWIEVLLQDDQRRTIQQSGQIVTRDMLFQNFFYQTGNALVPGDYWMVLRSSGKEIFHRKFTLTGDPDTLPAMGEMVTN